MDHIYVQLNHGEEKKEVPILVSEDGREVVGWKSEAKKLIRSYLDELGKVYARLAEFQMTGE